jgi:hypothetical protein
MAGLVESNLRNLPSGDADSVGFFQMRLGTWNNGAYAGYPSQPEKQLKWFLDQAEAVAAQRKARGQSVSDPKQYGEWIADIERPAAQYRGRYQLNFDKAHSLIDQAAKQNQSPSGKAVEVAAGLTPEGKLPTIPGTLQDKVRTLFERADAIDREQLPYQWGGGHGASPAAAGVPVDCSGAVSRLLGVNPRISSQFETFGQAGPGKHVTIYANGEHVLMEIDGHFWGTSATNPGGGAGWIPNSAISAQYLARFVARHPVGL